MMKKSFHAFLFVAICMCTTSTVFAKNVKFRKTQDVNFDETNIDGVVRNPDGAYLVQKRGIDFMPLYKVRRNFDENIKESAYYIK
jgi:hypothetical protein